MSSAAASRSALLSVRWERSDRWSAATLLAIGALVAAAVLAVAGLPPVELHGPLHYVGVMDPLCGGTRSVRLAALGQWAAAWRYNPAGVPLLILAGSVLVRATAGWTSGRWLTVRVNWTPSRRRAAWLICGFLLVLLEVNQQLHATLLTRHG